MILTDEVDFEGTYELVKKVVPSLRVKGVRVAGEWTNILLEIEGMNVFGASGPDCAMLADTFLKGFAIGGAYNRDGTIKDLA